MVDRKAVALSPVTIELAHIVEPGGVIVRRLELLRLEQLVAFGKVELPHLLLTCRTAHAGDLGDGTGVTCKEGWGAALATAHEGAGMDLRAWAWAWLSHARWVSTGCHHHGGLLEVDWLRLGDVAGTMGLTAWRMLLSKESVTGHRKRRVILRMTSK
jgi:hypothetical protein